MVAQVRGVAFKVYKNYGVLPASHDDNVILHKAFDDVVGACGFMRGRDYLDALEEQGVGVLPQLPNEKEERAAP